MPEPNDEWAAELRERGHEVGRPIGKEVLANCLDAAAEIVQVGSALPHAEIRIRSQTVAKRSAYSADGHDFLNSFIADDLATVAEQASVGKVGTVLCEYLRPDADLDTARRVDVRERLDMVLAATAPCRVPLGRWPSAPEHPLALSQQLAVNSVLRMLDTGALVETPVHGILRGTRSMSAGVRTPCSSITFRASPQCCSPIGMMLRATR